MIYGVNVFNYCDFNLYLTAIGKAFGSSSGAVNQTINFFFRFFGEDDSVIYYTMSVAMMSNDIDTAG